MALQSPYVADVVEVYARTITQDSTGKRLQNYNPIPVDVVLEGPEEQIRDVVEGMVESLGY